MSHKKTIFNRILLRLIVSIIVSIIPFSFTYSQSNPLEPDPETEVPSTAVEVPPFSSSQPSSSTSPPPPPLSQKHSAPTGKTQPKKVGRRAAQKYFNRNEDLFNESTEEEEFSPKSAFRNGIMTFHVGKFVSSDAFEWKGKGRRTDVAQATYGFTFYLSNWNGVDANLRADFIEFKIDDDHLRKLSLLLLLTLPKFQDMFPIYFGLGAGPGIYFQQIEGESNISLDYQLMMGARLLSRKSSMGAVIEFGLKNHLHLLSDGQLNGTYLSGGLAFTF